MKPTLEYQGVQTWVDTQTYVGYSMWGNINVGKKVFTLPAEWYSEIGLTIYNLDPSKKYELTLTSDTSSGQVWFNSTTREWENGTISLPIQLTNTVQVSVKGTGEMLQISGWEVREITAVPEPTYMWPFALFGLLVWSAWRKLFKPQNKNKRSRHKNSTDCL